jgi:hypothetical protein
MNTIYQALRGILLAAVLVAGAPVPSAAEVYKVVDEHGNVTYTDRAPDPGAEPIRLPELSVIEAMELPSTAEGAEEEQEAVTDIRELRRGYRDFKITSPQRDEHIRGTGNAVTISWDTRYQLQPGMTVHLFLDGEPLEPTRSSSITVQEVWRGEHSVSGKIVDAQNRTIANASPVTFFMHQHSVNFPNPGTQDGG